MRKLHPINWLAMAFIVSLIVWCAAITTAVAGERIAKARASEKCLSLELTPRYVMRVIDGDTFVLFSIATPPEERIRILGVDTPERGSGPTADSATAFTTRWLAAGNFSINACKRDSFGRLLATVTRPAQDLADTLIVLRLGVKK